MIYAIGDSYTEGAELPLAGYIFDGKRVPGKGAWPEVLSTITGKDILNKGLGGSGNTRIVKRFIDAVNDKTDGIIVGWTSAYRLELLDTAGIYDIWPGKNMWWITDDPTKQHRTELLRYLTIYHTEMHNKVHSYKNFLRQVILTQNLCKSHNINCTMFLAIDPLTGDLFKSTIETFDSVKSLLNMIDFAMFVDHSLHTNAGEWVKGTPLGPEGHPLELGHKIIANKVYEHIENHWVT